MLFPFLTFVCFIQPCIISCVCFIQPCNMHLHNRTVIASSRPPLHQNGPKLSLGPFVRFDKLAAILNLCKFHFVNQLITDRGQEAHPTHKVIGQGRGRVLHPGDFLVQPLSLRALFLLQQMLQVLACFYG